jgi:hypothetical protein
MPLSEQFSRRDMLSVTPYSSRKCLLLHAGVTPIRDPNETSNQPVGVVEAEPCATPSRPGVRAFLAAMAHPTTQRENRSSTAARESHPTSVHTAGISPVHFCARMSGSEIPPRAGLQRSALQVHSWSFWCDEDDGGHRVLVLV